MSTKTHRRLVPISALLALALIATMLAWPATTVAENTLDPSFECRDDCSVAALACSIGCFENYWWDFPTWMACEIGCENQLNACVLACDP